MQRRFCATASRAFLHPLDGLPLSDPNQRSTCERQLTPAHLAARWGHPAVLAALRSQGADLKACCAGRGWTPLQEAEEWRRPEAAALLRGDSGAVPLAVTVCPV